jgi:hypothetical protein
MSVILGIDPGGHGAIAAIDDRDGSLLEILDMPATLEANGRTATNPGLLAGIVARLHPRIAFVEFVAARPTDSKVGAFSFGRARGTIEGVCAALSVPIAFITAPVWKRCADVPPGVAFKDVARSRAIAHWPARADQFARKLDIDRAEAALIALAGLKREASR